MKYLLGVAAVVVIAVLAIIFISSPKKSANNAKTSSSAIKLTDYIQKNSQVSFTTQGRIVGDDQYRELKITVSPNERVIEVLDGYNETTDRNLSYANNRAAYDVFIHSIDNAGYLTKRSTSLTSEKGVCALGNRYIFDLSSDSKQIVRRWSTNCGGQGSFGGSSSTIRELFQAQITDYNNFISGVSL